MDAQFFLIGAPLVALLLASFAMTFLPTAIVVQVSNATIIGQAVFVALAYLTFGALPEGAPKEAECAPSRTAPNCSSW